MNIGMVAPGLSPGGAERLILEEVKSLQGFNHSVTIYTRSDDPDFREKIGVSDIQIREFPKVNKLFSIPKTDKLHVTKWLRKKLIADNIDFVFSHYHDLMVYLATLNCEIDYSCHINGSPFWFRNNPRLVPHKQKAGYQQMVENVTGHGEFQSRSISPKNIIYQGFREVLQKKALQKSQLITTLTEQVASELSFCYGIDPQVVRPGVSKEWFEMDYQIDPTDIQGVTTDNMLLNVGRLDIRKRNALLIKSFNKFIKSEERTDVTLVIGGSGEEEDRLRTITTELGIRDYVVFTGYIPEDQLPRYYAAANILTHPAWVAYGLVPLEAYVQGTKVALSTDTMVREIIGGEPNVETIPPQIDMWANKISTMLNEPNQEPNTSVVPTWSEFGDQKHQLLQDNKPNEQ